VPDLNTILQQKQARILWPIKQDDKSADLVEHNKLDVSMTFGVPLVLRTPRVGERQAEPFIRIEPAT
jgi:hypothetical protein